MGLGQGWEKIITGVSGSGKSVQQTVDGGYIVCSTHDSHSYLIKTDGNGDSLWTKSYAFHDEKFFSVEQTTDGGYIVCGYTNPANADPNVYLIKTDGNGNATSIFNIPTPSSNRELEKVVDVLGRDINPEKNKPFIEIYNDGTVEKKIIIE